MCQRQEPQLVNVAILCLKLESKVRKTQTILTKLTVQLNRCEGQANVLSRSAMSKLIQHKWPGETLEIGDESLLDNTTEDCCADSCNQARD